MDIFQALALGIIQGIAEWLPISSQGQVMAFSLTFLGLQAEEAFKYAVFLHIGTLIAATAYFRSELIEIISLRERDTGKFIAIALTGTIITAVPSYIFLKGIFSNSTAVLLLIGIFLIITGILQQTGKRRADAKISPKNALLVGLGQGFSVLPGISRSGTTTAIMLFEGFEPEKAFRLSFLLSVPSVLLGEIALSFFEPFEFEPNILIALVAAAITGFASIHILLKIVRKINFSVICYLFGLLYIIIALV